MTQSKILTAFLLLFITQFNWGQVNGHYYFIQDSDILVKNGTDTLQLAWSGGYNSSQISKIDLNNDGTEDLFVFDRTGNSIIPLVWNTSKEEYEFAPEYINKFPQLFYWGILRDYNCDGKKDIFSYVNGGVGVWKNTSNNGELSFEYVSDPYLRATLLGGTVANLYVSKVDIPDINDIDGDGDLDVLTFGIIGSRLEYYQNQSQELGYGCDSLIYEIANTCWGHFLETGSNTNVCTLLDTCDANSNVANPKNAKHSGSTVLSIDLNNDNVRDVVLGDVSFKNIVALYNDNKGVNMNTSMISQDVAFPSNTTPVDLQLFPAAFYEDIDQDGIKDFVCSPNTDNGTENHESIWYYKNYGTDSDPLLYHDRNNLLQDESIDVGTNAYPILFDYNNDNLLDLFVGNFGYYDFSNPISYQGQISLYQNVGSINSPSYTLITEDFANISQQNLGSGAFPTFGDIDDDGDNDMIIGTHDGMLHLFLNSSGSLGIMNLNLSIAQIQDNTSTTIDVGYGAKPVLFDLDGDNDLDLIVGEENGNLNYFENVGGVSNFSFKLQTQTMGNIDVSEWWTTIGNSTPCLIRNDQNETQLFVGSSNGQIHHYNGLDGNILGTYTEIDSAIGFLIPYSNTAPSFGHLNGDNLIDVIIGNERGGLSIYYGSDDLSLNTENNEDQLNALLFPNPAKNTLFIKGDTPNYFSIYSLSGQKIKSAKFVGQIDVNELVPGIYIVEINYENQVAHQRFIKE